MALHDPPLFLGKIARLIQYFGRYDDLADVVEQRAKPEPEEGLGVHPHAVRQYACKERDALAVALGVMIFALDRIAPVMRHLEKPGFQRCVATFHLCYAVLCL